ncbi:MAG TPA: helix-turn-helix transcriptional regulator [Polyangia bacterium]|nr:helix-turn-helix transcriptional regulator [Polyangia bacterium]
MRPLLKQLGARLKQLREEQGLSVVDVAGSTRVHKSTIYNIEAGRHPPSMKHLSELAQALRCDEMDLLCFPGAHPRHDVLEILRRAPLTAVMAVKSATADLVAGDERKARGKK